MKPADRQIRAPLTAATITDEQIRELLVERDPTLPRLTIDQRSWCHASLRTMFRDISDKRRREMRARCAEILNARAAK